LAAKLEGVHKDKIGSVKLVPSGGGCFELSLDGDLLYSKLQTGSFPDEDAIVELLADRLS